MKAKNDFVSEESYREYLVNYYIPSCLYAINNSGGLGGKSLERMAIAMARDIVDTILPPKNTKTKDFYKPINPEHEEDLS
jgi:hypothetical protein